MKTPRKSTAAGFTLVELLVVIAMIAVLVTLSVSAVFSFRKSADRAVAIESMRQLQTANVAYATENHGKFVPPEDVLDGVNYEWHENPEFVSQLKGSEATYNTADGTPDTSVPPSLIDPAIAREKPANFDSLAASYAYTRPLAKDPYRNTNLIDEARSAAFITADNGFIEHSTKGDIAYRHDEKAIVVYYDGHAEALKESEIEAKGGPNEIFWKAAPDPNPAP